MLDKSMMRRLLTQCGMETMVIDDATMRLAKAIFVASAKAEREECARIVETGPFAGTRADDAAAIRMRSNV